MTASLSTVVLMLSVIIGIYSVRSIIGEATDVNTKDKAALKRQSEQDQDENYSNIAISKAKNVRKPQEPPEAKSQTSFWSNVIPFYDTMKHHLTNQNNLINGMISNQSYDNSWSYNNHDTRNAYKQEEEYYNNHLMTPAASEPEMMKNTRYGASGYTVYPDNRQDYDEESDHYSVQDAAYPDSYPLEGDPLAYPTPPTVYNFVRRPSPIPRYPSVKLCPCNQVAGVRHIVNHHQTPMPVRQAAGCLTGPFFGLLASLAVTAWNLLQLVVTSSLPFIIPLVLLKFAFIGFKIYKFIKTVKLILKLVILLPFVLRVILPMIQNLMHHQSIVHLLKMRHDDGALENRQSLMFWNIEDLVSTGDMVTCASKTACEIGAFVAAKSYKHLPEKMSYMLRKRAEIVEKAKKKLKSKTEQEIFQAFFMALAKNWTEEKCTVYPCSISL